MKLTDENLIAALLSELQFVLATGQIPDSERNSADLRDCAAKRLGFADRKAFARQDDHDAPDADENDEAPHMPAGLID